jgi:hypothetical protein
MLQQLERATPAYEKITNLGYIDPQFMMRFSFDRRADYGNIVFELDDEEATRFNGLNLFVAPKDSVVGARRLVLINPTRYSEEPHAKEGFEKYGVFPAGVHPCEGVMAMVDIATDDVDGYPARLVVPNFKTFPQDEMADYFATGFSRHSPYCRTNRMSQLSDEFLRLSDPWQQFTALQNEHAQALLRAPEAFRNAPILRMNVEMAR